VRSSERGALVREALGRVGLSPAIADRSPYTLSGGEERLGALAAAIAHRPRDLLRDEPVAGLDRRGTQAAPAPLLAHREEGGAALVVTHDLEGALAWATRFLLLEDGRIAADLTAPQLGEAEVWEWLGPWLWDRGTLGRAHARLRAAGFDAPSPYVEPARCVEWLNSRLSSKRPPNITGSG